MAQPTVAGHSVIATRQRSKEPSFWGHLWLALLMKRFVSRYFAQLEVEFESLCPADYVAAHAAELAELRAANEGAPGWSTNHRLEYLLLEGLPDEILMQRSRVHHQRLLALVGPEGAAAFAEAFPKPADDWSGERLRAQALGVLLEVQRLRHVQSEFSRLRNRLLCLSLVPGCAFVSLALWYAIDFPGQPLIASVSIFGLLGGYLSVLLRLGVLRWGLQHAANYQQVDRVFWNLFLNVVLSTLQGALGAIVLYFVFSSNVLSSPAFPNLVDALQQAREAFERTPLELRAAGPYIPRGTDLNHQQFAQLMLWSTIAGFTERLVPDILGSLSKEAAAKRARTKGEEAS
jgi:hypothetical protein